MTKLFVCAILVGSSVFTIARADHHGMAMTSSDDSSHRVDVAVSLVAASFSPLYAAMMAYGGNYQGVVPSAAWSRGTVTAGASWSYYRLERNGLEAYGQGDVVAHGQVSLVRSDNVQAGVLAAVSAPTGDQTGGFGMGHAMAMPAAWGAWQWQRLSTTASVGYSRALMSGTHVHGMAPLVEPMNMSELTWSGSVHVTIDQGLRAGARVSGGVPIGMPGTNRVVGTLRVAWGAGRVDTAAELQGGLAGDPFNVRGVVSTAWRF